MLAVPYIYSISFTLFTNCLTESVDVLLSLIHDKVFWQDGDEQI